MTNATNSTREASRRAGLSWAFPLAAALLAACGTPLHSAASNGDLAQIQAQIAQGADIEAFNEGADKWTPLMYAAYNGQLEAVRALLDAGANPFAHGSGGTPYRIAKNQNYPAIAALISSYASVPGVAVVSRDSGLFVNGVSPHSPAKNAGIALGDRLLAVDQTSVDGLAIRLVRAKLYKASTLTVQKKGEAQPRTVSVAAAPQGTAPDSADRSSDDAQAPASPTSPAVPAAKPWWQ
jgi:C-terminal processing protease CtpA/Prc